ncbi:DUF5979 domain-containing protein [Brevibacterium aurantiacum]|uniref:DUF5979 domain-containing protein n=1 Tax=Brevibacterium aurantiacum TaxID=273384 RepID=UPI000F63E35A|nr:DUF5979 domain-containing protein [Brevibacterium aurantiacum]AZL04592.1 hypothetical protein CXR24_02475 [Brevibacterium aurantiacum]
MLDTLKAPPGRLLRFTIYLVTLILALSSALMLPTTASANTQAPADGSPIVFTDISFEKEEFPSGTNQRLSVSWKIEGEAQNPVTVSLDMPEGLNASNDRFTLSGPDGDPAGECLVQNNRITCTADEDFIENNPYDVSGSFYLTVQSTFTNTETIEHTYDIGGFENKVTILKNANWCDSNCEHGSQGQGKWGWYDNINDQIIWTVNVPAGEQGMGIGQKVSVTDVMDTDDYTLVRDGTYPRVLQAKSISYNSWGREGLDYRTVPTDKVKWSNADLTASFTTEAGLGSGYSAGECTTNQGKSVPCTRGTDGSFYQVQWKVDVNTPGKLDANGNRVFYNGAEWTIDGETKKIERASTTRYSGGGNVVGRNFGKFQIEKELTGDTTLHPEFEIKYTYHEEGQEPQERTGKFHAGGSLTSPEIWRGTTVTINEIKPTDPANVTWDDPVVVDADGNEVTELTFSAENKNLGKVTKLTLKNRAVLNKDTFQAKKSINNPDDVPLPNDAEYTLAYSYPADDAKGIPAGSGELKLPANGDTVESGDLPIGAVLTLKEIGLPNVPGATWGDPKLSHDTLTIGEDKTVTVDVTNRITQDVGQFQVKKSTSGDGQELIPEGTEFIVKYSYEGINGFEGGSGELTVAAGETSDLSPNIPSGATVTLEEMTPVDPEGGSWGEPQFSQTEFTVTKDQVVTIDLDNPIAWNNGDFSVQKVVEGDAAHLVDDDVAFTVDYSYELPEALGAENGTGDGTLTVLNDGKAVTSDPLPYDTQVTLSEVQPEPIAAATWTGSSFDHSTFTIGDETTFGVTLTNTVELDLGAFSVEKKVSGNGDHLVADDAEFTVKYSYPEGPNFEAGEGEITVTPGGEPVVVSDLPAGAQVTLEEVAPENPEGGTWTDVSWSEGNVVTIGKDETTAVTLDNAIELNTGNFSVAKELDGAGSGLLPDDASFVVHYEYEAGKGFEAGKGQFEVSADGTAVTSGQLPYGAEVHLTEAEPINIEGATWEGYEFSPSTVTIGDGTTAEVLLTNTFGLNEGHFSVTKAVEGSGAGLVPEDTEFTVEYSYPAGNGFEAGSGELIVKADGKTVKSDPLPYGAEVTLAEVEPVKVEGGTWVDFVFSTDAFTIGDGTTVDVLLANEHDLNSGHFSVVKALEGSGAGLVSEDTEFTVEYSYPAGNGFDAGKGELVVKADGTVATSEALPFGAEVTLSEVAPEAPEGGEWISHEFSPETVTIGDGTTAEVTLTNTIGLNDGFFSVTKAVEGTGKGLVPTDTEFTVEYSYPAGNGFDAGKGELVVKADGETVKSDPLPYGAEVALTEVEPVKIEGGTWMDFVFSTDTLTIGDGTTVDVLLTNENELGAGHFSVVKALDGSGADLVNPTTEFVVEYAYPAGDGFEAGKGELTVRADGTVATSGALPYGAELALKEAAPASVEGGEWTDHEFSTDTVTIGESTTVEVTLTNSIEADEVTDPGKPGESDEAGDPGKPGGPENPGDGGPLPRTGMSPWGALVAGLVLIALGAGAYFYTTRRKRG